MQEINSTSLHLGNGVNPVNNAYDYSKFKNLEDFNLDDELIEKFTPVAKKLNLSQESVETLLNLGLEMSKKQNGVLRENHEYRLKRDIEKYNLMSKEDSEIPNFNSGNINEYMRIADIAYKEFATDKLKEIFNSTGLNYHPELIKMFHKLGELMAEDGVDYYGKPQQEELTPAQILYGKPE